MYDLAFRIQVMILEFRKNLRYWVLALPIATLILFPITIGLSGYLYSFAVNKEVGKIALIPQDKSKINIATDKKEYRDLKSGKRLFSTRVYGKDVVKFGFRKLYYKIKFFDKDNKEVDKDNTKYENFMLPDELFYLTHLASTKAERMDVDFLTGESDLVNILPEDLPKFKKFPTTLSNLALNINSDDLFDLNFVLNNDAGKVLKDLRYQYLVTNKAGKIVYIGNLTISELIEGDKGVKSVTGLSYPLDTPKGELQYVADNNVVRYNVFEYEK